MPELAIDSLFKNFTIANEYYSVSAVCCGRDVPMLILVVESHCLFAVLGQSSKSDHF